MDMNEHMIWLRLLRRAVLTFVSSIEFGLADKGWTVDLIAAQENVGWIGIAPAYIACYALPAATIVTLMLLATISEKAIPL